MAGNLQLGIFSTNKYIPDGVNITLKLTKSSPAFYLWAPTEASGKNYTFKYEECYLVLKKIIVHPTILAKNEAAFKEGLTVKLPLKTTEIRTFTIPSGTFNFQSENLFGGRLPERIYVQFVDAEAFSGKITKNPYNFQHFDVETIKTGIEEKTNYGDEMSVNFPTRYLEGYNSLFGMVAPGEDGNYIERDLYSKDGYSIFMFNILCPTTMDAFIVQKPGNVKVFAKFRNALPQATTVIISGVFANMVEIDEGRNVKTLF